MARNKRHETSCCSWLSITIICAIILAAFSSCSSNGCTDNRSSIPLAGFFSTETGSTIALDSLEIAGIGAPGDSLLLASGERANAVYLPLRSEKSATAFSIAYRYEYLDYPELNDTIYFRYDAIPFFASEECGAMYRFHIKSISYSRHILDSIAVIATDSIITNADVENLRLYFKTSSVDQ